MKINFRISETMEEQKRKDPYLEDRVVRVPLLLRQSLGIPVGHFITFKSNSGIPQTLQVTYAYKEDVFDDPRLAYATSETFEKICTNFEGGQAHIEEVQGITLGCDPEVFLIDSLKGTVVPATKFFSKDGQVGHDGYMLEFRPTHGYDEHTVTTNIYGLIQSARLTLNQFEEGRRCRMLATSHFPANFLNLTAGFHLHFGLPKILLGRRMINKMVASQIINALDYYVGIPSIIPEGTADSFRRTTPFFDYGKPGNFRIDNRTLEYRVPGGYLMRHPILTSGLLAMGLLVVGDIVSRMKACTNCFQNLGEVSRRTDLEQIYPRLPSPKGIFDSICSINTDAAKRHLDNIVEDLKGMVGWKKREYSVQRFIACVKSEKTFDPNIEENWRSFYAQQQEQMVNY